MLIVTDWLVGSCLNPGRSIRQRVERGLSKITYCREKVKSSIYYKVKAESPWVFNPGRTQMSFPGKSLSKGSYTISQPSRSVELQVGKSGFKWAYRNLGYVAKVLLQVPLIITFLKLTLKTYSSEGHE